MTREIKWSVSIGKDEKSLRIRWTSRDDMDETAPELLKSVNGISGEVFRNAGGGSSWNIESEIAPDGGTGV